MSVEHVVTYFIRMHTHVVIVRPSSVGCKNVKLDKFEIKKKSNRYLCQQYQILSSKLSSEKLCDK